MSNKEPWGYEGSPWKNSTAFFTYLRGCLRKAWSNNPIKHNLIKKKRRQIPNPNSNGKKPTVWGFDCEICNGVYAMSHCQVDHIKPVGSLQKTEDIQGFVERLLYVSEDDLQVLCVECHEIKTLQERLGVSFEEAKAHKFAISLQKKKDADKHWLIERGFVPAKKKEDRRMQIINAIVS